jgi:protein tyrosine phosphatase (PTP) superfamily phosphohydrolase (DUF442 family)
MELDTIQNFIALDATYGTAGQPSEEQLQAVAQHGYRVVVNLGLLDPRYCLPDEAGSVARLGLSYHHIPVDFQQPRLEDYRAFESTLLSARPHKVFVHCAANYRVSCFMSLFGARHLGWSAEQAEAHFKRLWQPNEVWTRFFAEAQNAASLQ